MLEKEQDKIDAVLVSTPDHIHAPATAMALRMKKHVYCEKPLAHTVFEARTVRELAKQNNLVTQMGTQIHAENNYRRVVELIQSGADASPCRRCACLVSGQLFGRPRTLPVRQFQTTWTGISILVRLHNVLTVREFIPEAGEAFGILVPARWEILAVTTWISRTPAP